MIAARGQLVSGVNKILLPCGELEAADAADSGDLGARSTRLRSFENLRGVKRSNIHFHIINALPGQSFALFGVFLRPQSS